MCFFLYAASPLTLSEVRSMLAPGITAELLNPGEQRRVLSYHPDAQTAVRLLHGACSCDLVRFRQPVSREDEAHLRARYRELGLTREQMIISLENHRRALSQRTRPEGHWPKAVSAFVAEHARNAGPTLYYLDFSPAASLELGPNTVPPVPLSVSAARENPGTWLPEKTLVMVVRQQP
jgi:hypothetical protein